MRTRDSFLSIDSPDVWRQRFGHFVADDILFFTDVFLCLVTLWRGRGVRTLGGRGNAQNFPMYNCSDKNFFADNEQDDVVLDSQMNSNRTDFRLCAWETIQPKENKQTRTERSDKPGLIPE